jgi:DNA repair protein RadC
MIKYADYEKEDISVALSAIDKTPATNDTIQSTKEVENYLKIQLASQPDEWFAVLFLISQHRLIRPERLLRGSVNSSYANISGESPERRYNSMQRP